MNYIQNFKSNYLVVDNEYNQSIHSSQGFPNNHIEMTMYQKLCKNVSDPIRKKIQFELGSVYFINDNDDDGILFKFSEINLIFNTSQSIEMIVNQIEFSLLTVV